MKRLKNNKKKFSAWPLFYMYLAGPPPQHQSARVFCPQHPPSDRARPPQTAQVLRHTLIAAVALHSHVLPSNLRYGLIIYPNNTRDVYLYIYWVSAYMG